MASPFHELPGLRKYRDTVFEWRSLLHTPCYGFSGPNACYSSTCSHNPSSSESEKRIAKTKPSNLSKSSFKYNANARKSSNCERDVYQNAYKSSPTSHLTVKMRAFSYNQKTALDEYEYKMNGYVKLVAFSIRIDVFARNSCNFAFVFFLFRLFV